MAGTCERKHTTKRTQRGFGLFSTNRRLILDCFIRCEFHNGPVFIWPGAGQTGLSAEVACENHPTRWQEQGNAWLSLHHKMCGSLWPRALGLRSVGCACTFFSLRNFLFKCRKHGSTFASPGWRNKSTARTLPEMGEFKFAFCAIVLGALKK